MGNGFGVNAAFVVTGAEPRRSLVTLNVLVAFFKSTASVLAEIIGVPEHTAQLRLHSQTRAFACRTLLE